MLLMMPPPLMIMMMVTGTHTPTRTGAGKSRRPSARTSPRFHITQLSFPFVDPHSLIYAAFGCLFVCELVDVLFLHCIKKLSVQCKLMKIIVWQVLKILPDSFHISYIQCLNWSFLYESTSNDTIFFQKKIVNS